jgi:hypothetical protein
MKICCKLCDKDLTSGGWYSVGTNYYCQFPCDYSNGVMPVNIVSDGIDRSPEKSVDDAWERNKI